MFYNLLLIPLNLLNNLLWKHSFSRILGDTFSFSPIQDKYYIHGFSILLLMMLIHFPQPYVIFAWIQWLVSVVPLLWSGVQGLASTWIFESWLCFLSFSLCVSSSIKHMVIQLFIGTSTRQWAEEEGEYELMSTQLWSCGTIPTSLTCTTRAIFSSCCKVELLLAGNSSYAIQV